MKGRKNALRIKLGFVLFSLITVGSLFFPIYVLGIDDPRGEEIFIKNCSGCHVKGSNIIRRKKTLKLKDLKNNGLDNPEAIARVARTGVGIMSGYEGFLKEGEDELVANWIWEQAQKAWTHG